MRSHPDLRCLAVTILAMWLFAVGGQVAAADDVTEPTSLITLNTRTFDLRSDVRELRREDHFIPLRDVAWINHALRDDPFLSQIVVQFKVWPEPLLNSWPTLAPQRMFPIVRGLPNQFLIDGLFARSSDESNMTVLYVPIDEHLDFQVTCYKETKVSDLFGSCFVTASYPPDPRIALLARIYQPGVKPFHFREIAHRMREMPYAST